MLALHQADDLSRVYSARRTMVAGIGSKPHPPTAHQFDLIFNDVSFKDVFIQWLLQFKLNTIFLC